MRVSDTYNVRPHRPHDVDEQRGDVPIHVDQARDLFEERVVAQASIEHDGHMLRWADLCALEHRQYENHNVE